MSNPASRRATLRPIPPGPRCPPSCREGRGCDRSSGTGGIQRPFVAVVPRQMLRASAISIHDREVRHGIGVPAGASITRMPRRWWRRRPRSPPRPQHAEDLERGRASRSAAGMGQNRGTRMSAAATASKTSGGGRNAEAPPFSTTRLISCSS